ncbi:MAG: damage-inducible protein DinB, partial [Alphaproteobacteria bacterium]|nr:damage-inducible protein DinB [Alphaproteobacteria bacterium]
VAADFEGLSAARAAFDDGLLASIESWPETWLDETLTFTSARHGGERSLPRTFVLGQMFNHATHHRSQVTAELHKLGLDYGNTDMPFNPYSQYRARGAD